MTTTHGCGYQPGDHVVVEVSGWDIPGTITKLSPYKIYVNMSGCHKAVEPAQVTAEVS